MSSRTFADVSEGVRATIARYTLALDDGRTDDVIATFAADGSFELEGKPPAAGIEALRTMYERWVPRVPQRHLVSNTLVDTWSDTEATAISDVVLLVKIDEAWSVQFVARYHDLLVADGDTWKFASRKVLT